MILPPSLLTEKNKLTGTAPWIILVSVVLPDATALRLAKNTEDVTFGGHTYQAFPFDLDSVKNSDNGAMNPITLTIYDTALLLRGYVDQYQGLIGSPVELFAVHTDNLTENYASLTLNYQITACHAEESSITWSLGAENPMAMRFPPLRADPRSCGWRYKGAGCGYAGGITSCARTLDDCRAHGNSPRFGGRPGLQAPGVKFL